MRPGSPVKPLGGPRPSVGATGENQLWFDAGAGIYVDNHTPVPWSAIAKDPEVAAMVQWATTNFGSGTGVGRKGSLIARDRYVQPRTTFEEMGLARWSAENDDVVSGVLDTTESLAFSKMGFSTPNEDEEDVWNQVAADLDLDARMREMWRELFIASQYYCAVYWGTKSYKVRGKSSKGIQRKKTFEGLRVPLGLTLLNPQKVVPVGNFMFGNESLVYIADANEALAFDRVLAGIVEDPIVSQIILGQFEPTIQQTQWLGDHGFPSRSDGYYVLNPQNVYRHTATRPQFEPLAAVRLKSVFRWLDMKAQLMEMDRAFLIGGTNFIVLIKKGSDDIPGTPNEISGLSRMVQSAARIPVLVGDHRLQVEIVTPKVDQTLKPDKYEAIDTHIAARLYQMFMPTGSAGGDDSPKLARVISRGMESRRHMIKRNFEKYLMRKMVEVNDQFTEQPTLEFHPKRIALDFDAALAAYLIDLRDRGEISRDTILSEFDFDESDEASKIERERDKYDKIFQTIVPFNGSGVAPGGQNEQPGSDTKEDPRTGGRNGGGNRRGGGAAPGSGQGKSKEQQR